MIEDPVRRKVQQFNEACERLGLARMAPVLRLIDVITQIDADSSVSHDDLKWLEQEKKYQVLAVYYEHLYSLDGLTGHLTSASKFWRKADRPDEALKRANVAILATKDWIRAAGYTTGAAAYLDKDDLRTAEEWLNKALELAPNHPYTTNVHGRLEKKKGNIAEAMRLFARARELGWTDGTT